MCLYIKISLLAGLKWISFTVKPFVGTGKVNDYFREHPGIKPSKKYGCLVLNRPRLGKHRLLYYKSYLNTYNLNT